jgi:DNA-binding transcriptional regulator YhcF (GntR family)
MQARRAEIVEALRARLTRDIHLGRLKPGDRLPSVRRVSAELGVNPRVVLAAYDELEREALVERRPRSGIFLAPAPGVPAGATATHVDWLASVVADAVVRGLSPAAFAHHAMSGLATVQLRAVCVECNADSAASIRAELEQDFGLATRAVNVFELQVGDPAESLANADVVVTTVYHAAEVQKLAAALRVPVVVASLPTELFAEVACRLPAGPLYFIASDPRFVDKLHRLFASIDGGGNLRPVLYRGGPLELDDDAPVYATRSVWARLPEGALRARVRTEARQLATESARELLGLIIRANLAAAPERPLAS